VCYDSKANCRKSTSICISRGGVRSASPLQSSFDIPPESSFDIPSEKRCIQIIVNPNLNLNESSLKFGRLKTWQELFIEQDEPKK